jgi:hypothetical protein
MLSIDKLIENEWVLKSIDIDLFEQPVVINFFENGKVNDILGKKTIWTYYNGAITININDGEYILTGYWWSEKNKIFGNVWKIIGQYYGLFVIHRLIKEFDENYLIENDWTIKYIADVEFPNIVPVNFYKNKVFKYKDNHCTWNLNGRFLEIQINNNYVTLNAEILLGSIKGKAKNIVGFEWDFEILPRDDENQKKINRILFGKKWELKESIFPDLDSALEYFTLDFLDDNKLVIGGKDGNIKGGRKYVWEIKQDKIFFSSIDKFITYECSLNNKNVLECNAENLNGVIFSAYFEQFIETKTPILSDKLLKIDADFRQYQFQLNGNHKYLWSAIWSYYPKNRFRDDELSEIDLLNRYLTYHFKDGSNPIKFAQIFASAILRFFDKHYNGEIEKYTLTIIPASNKFKTDIRFKDFCNYLISYTGLINGFEMISNENISREPIHHAANREIDLRNYIKVDKDVKNKKIVVIDDVRTSGRSSNIVYDLLMENGAQEVIFFYLAKTVGLKI